MTWEEAIEDPHLDGLPYKIELNGYGNIVMSPTRFAHSGYQGEICNLLNRLLDGKAVPEAAIQTSDNVKVADVAWLTHEHWEVARLELAASTAPAICVEVTSKSKYQRELNEKKALYFEAGAKEVWFCDRMGKISFYTPAGRVATSPMCPKFPARI